MAGLPYYSRLTYQTRANEMGLGAILSAEDFLEFAKTHKTAAILNSRQSRRSGGRDAWVRATRDAVEQLTGHGITIVTSIGMNTWELVVHLANVTEGEQMIVLPSDLSLCGFRSVEEVIESFRLDTNRSHFLMLSEGRSSSMKTWQPLRDRFIAGGASLLLPVSLRKRGSLEALLAEAGACVDHLYTVAYDKGKDRVVYDWRSVKPNLELAKNWDFLTHWTRSCLGLFPGESHFEYYDKMASEGDFAHSAFHALERILSEGKIRASERFMRKGNRVVSLTSLDPIAAMSLMRWRKRYGYYSFEPYGIAIDREFAEEMGCRQVVYGDEAAYPELAEEDRPFFQVAGSAVSDWRPEAEWRWLGDFDLNEVPSDKISVITLREQEAVVLRKKCDYEVLAMTLGD